MSLSDYCEVVYKSKIFYLINVKCQNKFYFISNKSFKIHKLHSQFKFHKSNIENVCDKYFVFVYIYFVFNDKSNTNYFKRIILYSIWVFFNA